MEHGLIALGPHGLSDNPTARHPVRLRFGPGVIIGSGDYARVASCVVHCRIAINNGITEPFILLILRRRKRLTV